MTDLAELSKRFGLGDVPDVMEVSRIFADDAVAREFLEALVWPTGAFCPHCGSVHIWRHKKAVAYQRKAPLKKKTERKRREGVHECADCFRQFTVTTRTPMHATKLPLGKWIVALYLVVTSSKGIASVINARWLGVDQETAWKMGHALRELMDLRHEAEPALSGIVEVDTKRIGGAPRQQKHVYHPPGKGSAKPIVAIATERQGEVRAAVVQGESQADIEPLMTATIDSSANIMSDQDRAIAAAAKGFARHDAVNHSAKEFVRKERRGKTTVKVHSNTADAFGGQLERAKVGVYHRFGDWHLQRYVDEIAFRWNHRRHRAYVGKDGLPRTAVVIDPVVQQMADLLRHAVGRQVRLKRGSGLVWPDPIAPGYPAAPVRLPKSTAA